MLSDIKPEKRKPPYLRYLIAVIASILMFFGSQYAYETYQHALVPPTVTLAAPFIWIDNPDKPSSTLHAGEGFWIRIFTNRLQVCSVDTQYSIMQVSNVNGTLVRKVFYAYPISRNRSIPGESITDKYLVLPIWVKSGEYIVTRQSDYDCDGQKISQDGQSLAIIVK